MHSFSGHNICKQTTQRMARIEFWETEFNEISANFENLLENKRVTLSNNLFETSDNFSKFWFLDVGQLFMKPFHLPLFFFSPSDLHSFENNVLK